MDYKDLLKESFDETNVTTTMNVSAGIIMKYSDEGRKQVLMIQRAKDDHWPNHWEFPRGKCDQPIGESLIRCCQREIKEETNLDVEVVTMIDTFEYLADKGTRKSICHNFLCKMKDDKQPVKLSKEHQDYKWVSELGEVALLALPDQKRTLEKVLNNDRPITTTPDIATADNNVQLENYLQELSGKNK